MLCKGQSIADALVKSSVTTVVTLIAPRPLSNTQTRGGQLEVLKSDPDIEVLSKVAKYGAEQGPFQGT